jgi:hypothetical protein
MWGMTIDSPSQGFWCERLDDEMVMDGGRVEREKRLSGPCGR